MPTFKVRMNSEVGLSCEVGMNSEVGLSCEVGMNSEVGLSCEVGVSFQVGMTRSRLEFLSRLGFRRQFGPDFQVSVAFKI